MTEEARWSSNFDTLGWQIDAWRKSKGFHTPTSMDTEEERDALLGKLMLIVTEIAEAAEAVRHKDMLNFKEEMADTAIRLLDLCTAMDFSLMEEIHKKMDKNAERPHKHGKETSL